MRLILGIASALGAAVLMAGTAGAQELRGSYDWTGFHVGVIAGGGSFEGTVLDRGGDALDTDGQEVGLQGFGGLGGAGAGYTYQHGSMIVGVEGDIAATNYDETSTFDDDYRVDATTDWIATLRAKLGVSVDRAQFYVTGGVGFASIYGCASEETDTCEPNDDDIAQFDDVVAGFVAGVGTELALTDSISFKGEYLFFQSGKDAVDYDSENDDDVAEFSTNAHMLRIGANYRF